MKSIKGITLIECAIVAAIVLILAAVLFGGSEQNKSFREVCAKANGTTVWDGRQYQCIKPEAGRPTP